jgi:hypothetical protein
MVGQGRAGIVLAWPGLGMDFVGLRRVGRFRTLLSRRSHLCPTKIVNNLGTFPKFRGFPYRLSSKSTDTSNTASTKRTNTVTTRTAASIKALMTIKDMTQEDAKKIRELWLCKGVRAPYKFSRGTAREGIDAILKTYGVEFLGFHKRTGDSVYYCNAGDSYATTILFHGHRLIVSSWGDLMEANKVREFEQF